MIFNTKKIDFTLGRYFIRLKFMVQNFIFYHFMHFSSYDLNKILLHFFSFNSVL